MNLASIIESIKFLPCPTCGGDVAARKDPATGIYQAQRCHECLHAVDAAEDRRDAISLALGSIPRRYLWAKFSAPELGERVTPPEQRTFAYAALGDDRVVLVGPAGSGKTSLAVAMLRERARVTSTPGLFVHAYRLGIARIQHRAGAGEAGAVSDAMREPLVLLDDVGIERQTANNAVPDVIFERDAEELPTIVTTGFDDAGIARLYGDGVARRLFEGATVIKLGEGLP